jgi:hypothetical protein
VPGRPLHSLHQDRQATYHCSDVLALANELRIGFHFIPPGLADLLQPLDRSVFGSLKRQYGAPHRHETSQKDDMSVTNADFAAYRILAGDSVSKQATHSRRECFDSDTEALLAQLREAVVP